VLLFPKTGLEGVDGDLKAGIGCEMISVFLGLNGGSEMEHPNIYMYIYVYIYMYI
jgi:hypothetical protein